MTGRRGRRRSLKHGTQDSIRIEIQVMRNPNETADRNIARLKPGARVVLKPSNAFFAVASVHPFDIQHGPAQHVGPQVLFRVHGDIIPQPRHAIVRPSTIGLLSQRSSGGDRQISSDNAKNILADRRARGGMGRFAPDRRARDQARRAAGLQSRRDVAGQSRGYFALYKPCAGGIIVEAESAPVISVLPMNAG